MDVYYSFYSKIQLKEYSLGTDSTNCWFLTTKNEIACIKNIIHRNTHPRDVQFCCIEIDEKRNFFIIPLESRHLNIYCAREDALLNKKEKLFILTDVKCKLVRLQYLNLQVFVPLLHTNNCATVPVEDDDHDDDDE